MPNLSQNLSFILLGEDRTASKTMTGAAATAEKVTARIGASFQKVGGIIGGEFGNIISGVGGGIDELGQKTKHLSTIMTVGGGVALTAGIGLQQFGSAATQATDQLNAAITATGAAATDYTERIDKAVKKNENFDRSAVDSKQALQILTQATGDTGKALDKMQVVTDLAAAKHISLADAATLVAKILGGSGARTLVQFGIHMDGVGTKTEQSKRALDELSKKLDGQAKASVNNFGGQVGVLKTKVTDFAEEVAGPVGGALTALGGVATATGLILDIYKAKQAAAAAATLANAAAADAAGASEVALTADTIALDAAMDANPIVAVTAAIGALSAVAVGVGVSGISQLTSATHDYTAALQASNGVIDENVRKTASKALEDDGAYAAATKLGIAHNLVLEATLGDAKAQKQLADQLGQVRASLVNLNDPAFTQGRVLNGLTGAAGDTRTALEKLGNTVDAEGGQFRSQAAAVREANSALQTYTSRANAAASSRLSGAAAAYANRPHHAQGGDIMHDETAVVGENGPELVRLPGGSHVYPHGRGPNAGGVITINNTFTGDVHGSPNAYAQSIATALITALRQGHINGSELLSALAS